MACWGLNGRCCLMLVLFLAPSAGVDLSVLGALQILQDASTLARLWKSAYSDRHRDLPLLDTIRKVEPYGFGDVKDLIHHWGYPTEVHEIMTRDGYIKTMVRIPGSPKAWNKSSKVKKSPVLLHHGIVQSASDWVINMPYQSLGYLLADAGYDVWLASGRGSRYGMKHAWISSKHFKFWDFSFEEMGIYDLPAMIDYILSKTNNKQLHYVGYSFGTCMFFVMMSSYPEYNAKVKSFVGLAPIMSLQRTRSVFRDALPFLNELKAIWPDLGGSGFLPNDVWQSTFRTVCNSKTNYICRFVLYYLVGYNPKQLNYTRVPLYYHHTSSGASWRSLFHLMQWIVNPFTKYDFGPKQNYKLYGQPNPPKYNISRVMVPSHLFYGENDAIADPMDVKTLAMQLPNLRELNRVDDRQWCHADFLWGMDAHHLVYDRVINILRNSDDS